MILFYQSLENNISIFQNISFNIAVYILLHYVLFILCGDRK